LAKFQTVKALGESFEESLESSKWNVWHGNERGSHQTGNAECKYFRFPETVEASRVI